MYSYDIHHTGIFITDNRVGIFCSIIFIAFIIWCMWEQR